MPVVIAEDDYNKYFSTVISIDFMDDICDILYNEFLIPKKYKIENKTECLDRFHARINEYPNAWRLDEVDGKTVIKTNPGLYLNNLSIDTNLMPLMFIFHIFEEMNLPHQISIDMIDKSWISYVIGYYSILNKDPLKTRRLVFNFLNKNFILKFFNKCKIIKNENYLCVESL